MGEIGQFILYAAANYYLSNEFDQCKKICSLLYEGIKIESSSLFKGNLLRFKALVLEQEAQLTCGDGGELDNEQINGEILKDAEDAINRAIDSF